MTDTVYRAFAADDHLLYVGYSAKPEQRIKAHQRLAPWAADVARWTFQEYATTGEALDAETQAILDEAPQWNIRGANRQASPRLRLSLAASQAPPDPDACRRQGIPLALDDPARLEKAARMIRFALERGRLTPADLGLDDARRAS